MNFRDVGVHDHRLLETLDGLVGLAVGEKGAA